MEIGRIHFQIRNCMNDFAVPELPSWPTPLSVGFLHPDYLLRMLSSFEGELYTFQNLIRNTGTFFSRNHVFPSFILMKKPFSNKWLEQTLNLCSKIIDPAAESGTIPEISGNSGEKSILKPDGVSWNLSWLGISFGEIRIISGYYGELFPVSSAILTVDLEKVAFIQEKKSDALHWEREFPVTEVIACSFFPQFLLSSKNTSTEIISQINSSFSKIEEYIDSRQPIELYIFVVGLINYLFFLKYAFYITNEFFCKSLEKLEPFLEKTIKQLAKVNLATDSQKESWR
ncbi:MAG: hypothetical protein HQM10_18005 [Candidatus Riflebacteria bacterium]|nr:hypothetical protein [Candidatus Riflebacteria bacterium]